jgi:hypothetical protein
MDSGMACILPPVIVESGNTGAAAAIYIASTLIRQQKTSRKSTFGAKKCFPGRYGG